MGIFSSIIVVYYVVFTPFWCIGKGKSLIGIRVESMTSPLVLT